MLNQTDNGSIAKVESLYFKIQAVIIVIITGIKSKQHLDAGHLFFSDIRLKKFVFKKLTDLLILLIYPNQK